ncbi:MAG: hypothetical protein ACYTGC_11270 [Planctomycetota bacterium]|jgi:hypothetical protein
MRTFHHIGIPTDRPQVDETHLGEAGVFITDAQSSPNRIEWLRFETNSPMPDLLKTLPHIAYEVDDLEAEMKGAEVLLEPFSPLEGVTVAFIIEEGAPIELMQMA